MGEAKRRKMRSCICDSGISAAACCWSGGRWFKQPAQLNLTNTGNVGNHERCYLCGTNSCSTKISREHLISESVLDVLSVAGIKVSGFPWQCPDEEKIIGKGSLTANCLCTAHNSALSPLDSAAQSFFKALRICSSTETGPDRSYIFSGHDIERWLFKTLAAMAATRNLSFDGDRLSGSFHSTVSSASLIQSPSEWRYPIGLYLMQGLGENVGFSDTFSLAPLTLDGADHIVGMLTEVLGLQVGLVASSIPLNNELAHAYRPGKLRFRMAGALHTIYLSWLDSHKHGDIEYSLRKPPVAQ